MSNCTFRFGSKTYLNKYIMASKGKMCRSNFHNSFFSSTGSTTYSVVITTSPVPFSTSDSEPEISFGLSGPAVSNGFTRSGDILLSLPVLLDGKLR